MSVPVDVPPDVPGKNRDDSRDARPAATRGRRRPSAAPSYVTKESCGWRFQLRLSAGLLGDDFRLAGCAPTLRASLGPRSCGEARRLGRQLAVLCEAVAAATVATHKEQKVMSNTPSGDQELVAQVIDACRNAIGHGWRRRRS